MYQFLICLSLFLSIQLCGAEYLVNRSVINMYSKPTEETDVVSQAIYGAPVTIADKTENGWSHVRTQDDYVGWVHTADLIESRDYLASSLLRPVKSLFAHLYRDADTSTYQPLMTLPFSAMVRLTQIPDASTRWLQVQLIDGKMAWIQRGDLDLNPKTKTLNEMLALSHQFIGLPYTWGGVSSFGFDCSGFVQTLFKQMGVLLPRDSYMQANSPLLIPVERANLIPGDLIFFGETKITHVGIYLGNDEYINAGVRDNMPRVTINNLLTGSYHYNTARRVKPLQYKASMSPITADIKAKLTHSYKDNSPLGLDDLKYLQMSYWGYDGCVHEGELVVHHGVAQDVMDIFGELFEARFPIEKMKLIDVYQANDDLSMADNNSSALCVRMVTGSTTDWSKHSYGCAVDINPLVNPYAKNGKVLPKEGLAYLDRESGARGQIVKDDVCYKAFLKRGWSWGGDWMNTRGYVDYQHFDIDTP